MASDDVLVLLDRIDAWVKTMRSRYSRSGGEFDRMLAVVEYRARECRVTLCWQGTQGGRLKQRAGSEVRESARLLGIAGVDDAE
jgi:hypothetical protein